MFVLKGRYKMGGGPQEMAEEESLLQNDSGEADTGFSKGEARFVSFIVYEVSHQRSKATTCSVFGLVTIHCMSAGFTNHHNIALTVQRRTCLGRME